MDKFLYICDAADDAYCAPLSSLVCMTVAANATILMQFKGGTSGAQVDAHDEIALTITADKEKDVLAGIVAKINAHPNGDPFVVVCDDVNSVFAHPDILSCTITLDT